MIAPYIAIASTGIPAAARSRGFLRWYLLYDIAMTCGIKLAFIHFQHWDDTAHKMIWPLYWPVWGFAEPVGMALAACAVLKLLGAPEMVPVIKVPPLECYSSDLEWETKRLMRERWKKSCESQYTTRSPFRWWIAVPALAIQAWAGGYPQRWPGSWLHAEIHAVAFCCLLFGLAMVAERRNAALALLFLGTSAALYPAVWAMWIRPWLMWFQAACYLWLAVAPSDRT